MVRETTEGRQSLLAAARRVIAEQGLEGLKVRSLAEAAGVSVGLVVYHFPDRDAMRLEVHRSLVADYLRRRVELVGAHVDPRRQVIASAVAGVPPLMDAGVIRPLFELHGLARRSEAHATLMTRLWEDEMQIYVDVIEAGIESDYFAPSREVQNVAQSLLALEDGLALHQVSGNAALPPSAAIEIFAQSATEQLGCPSLVALASLTDVEIRRSVPDTRAEIVASR